MKTKDSSKIISNIYLYFENLGTAIFEEHLLVAVFITKYFYCNLQFLF